MNFELCVECNQHPVYIKKRKLCGLCYNRLVKKEKLNQQKTSFSLPTIKKMDEKREINFIKNFFDNNSWVYHPAIFRLDGTNYEPDFYDGDRNVFIEVAGSRQAYHINKDKYKMFRVLYPKIELEIRREDGVLVDETNNRLSWLKP